jgi:glycosyltransferase involved in cell wall biosynthesis
MPAYNAQSTITDTLNAIPEKHTFDEILVVDDCSSDQTVRVAESLGLRVITHKKNLGYGGNQKTCYTEALKFGAETVVMLHPDGQYDPRVLPAMVQIVELGVCDVLLGSRIRTRREALAGGMPLWKYIANRVLTFIENFALGQTLGEFHSGLRCYSRKALETVNFMANSNDFVFDQEFLIQAAHAKLKLGDIPVPVRYFPEASSINFKRSVKYGTQTLLTLGALLLHKTHLRKDPRFQIRTAS